MCVFTGYFDGFLLFVDEDAVLAGLVSKSFQAILAFFTRRVLIECDRIPYHFHNVSVKKILNWIVVEVSVLFKPKRPWGWPTHIMIEPTNHCDLRCPLCPVTKGLKRSKGYMDYDLFKKVIDEIGDSLFFVLLWDWGEPFLNPGIYEMISYARKKGIKVICCTNGHSFLADENVEKVVLSGLNTLTIAVDGACQETYEQYRKGGDFDAVIRGMRKIVAKKRELKVKTPIINLRFIVMKHNEHEISLIKELAKTEGADVLTFMTLNPYIDAIYCDNEVATTENKNNYLPVNASHRRFRVSQAGKTRVKLKNNPCKHLWNNPVVHWNGAVCPCTYDYYEKHALGNLKEYAFKKIWHGLSYRNIRKQFCKGWEGLSLCRECSYGYEGGDLGREAISEAFYFNSPDQVVVEN